MTLIKIDCFNNGFHLLSEYSELSGLKLSIATKYIYIYIGHRPVLACLKRGIRRIIYDQILLLPLVQVEKGIIDLVIS